MTFFSGTDINTLKIEGSEKTHFLSLIVNNVGTYSAKITSKTTETFVGQIIRHSDTFDNEVIIDENNESHNEKTVLTVYNLDIVKQTTACDNDMESRYNFIKNKIDSLKKRESSLFTPMSFSDKKLYEGNIYAKHNDMYTKHIEEKPHIEPIKTVKSDLKDMMKTDTSKNKDSGFTDAVKFLNKLFSLDIFCNTTIQDIEKLDEIFKIKHTLLEKEGCIGIEEVVSSYCEILLNYVFGYYGFITDEYDEYWTSFQNTIMSHLSDSSIDIMNRLCEEQFTDYAL